MKRYLLIFLFSLFSVVAWSQQKMNKNQHIVTDKTIELLGNEKERLVRFEGVLIGLENLDLNWKRLLIWLPPEYSDLLKSDNGWYLNDRDEIVLLELGKIPYSYEVLEEKPVDVKRLLGQSLINDTKYFGEAKRKKLWATERASYKIVQAFEDADTSTLKQFLATKFLILLHLPIQVQTDQKN